MPSVQIQQYDCRLSFWSDIFNKKYVKTNKQTKNEETSPHLKLSLLLCAYVQPAMRTGLQWWIYDTFKTVMGMGTTGGSSAPKAIK